MEKKELRERLTELAKARGFVCEAPSGKVKDLQLTFNQKELVELIDQEVDRAREEVLYEIKDEIFFEEVAENLGEKISKERIKNIIDDKLSKLTQSNMENWRGLFRERFVIEENTEERYLRKYDHRTIVEELEHFIEQELDKAREEGKKEAFTKDEWFMLKLAMNDIFNSGNTAYEEISEKIESYLN